MRDDTMQDDVLADDDLRFVDVLLEEELAAPRFSAVPPPRRGPQWLVAALVLLGIGVLVGATLLRRDPAAPAQGPVEKPAVGLPFVPKDAPELAAFLRQVVAVRVQPLREIRRGRESEWVALPGSEAIERDGERLRAFRGPWRQWRLPRGEKQLAEPAQVQKVRAQITAADGRRLDLYFTDADVLPIIGDTPWTPGAPAAVQLRRLIEQAQQNERATRARVTTLAELREVPTSVRWLSCAAFAIEELQEQLPRLRALESLGIEGSSDDRIGTVLASLPILAELDVDGTGLTEVGWSRLAKLPRLQALKIRGSIAGLSREGLAEVGGKLLTLAITGGPEDEFPVRERLLPSILGLQRLQELQVAVAFEVQSGQAMVLDWDRSSLAASLVAMPNLRRLAFAARHGDSQAWQPVLHVDQGPAREFVKQLAQGLAKSRIEKLRLAAPSLDEATVRSLAGIDTLRELDLGRVGFSPEASAALAQLPRLTRLDVSLCGWSAAQLATLRTGLPNCHVLGLPDWTGRSYGPLSDEPSWTRDD